MASALVTAMIACVFVPTKVGQVPSSLFGPTDPFQPRIVPSSVANRKKAGALDGLPAPLSETQNGETDDSPTPHGFIRRGSTKAALWTIPFASVNGFLLATRSV